MKTFPIMLNLRGRLAVVVGAGEVGLRKVRSLLEAGAKVRLVAGSISENVGFRIADFGLTKSDASLRSHFRPTFAPANSRIPARFREPAPADSTSEGGVKSGENPKSEIRNPKSAPCGMSGVVTVIREDYRKDLLDGAFLVFACTDDRAVNARIAVDARAAGALVNAVDQPDDCDFLMPSTARDGDVVLAIGTGGAAPALAAWLRRRVADALPERIGEFASALASLREVAGASIPDVEKRMAAMKTLASEDSYHQFLKTGLGGLRKRAAELGICMRT